MTAHVYDRVIRTRDRLLDVARLGLDREADRLFLRDIVAMVAQRLETPFGVADVLLNDAQVFLATHGPVPDWAHATMGTPLEWAFCRPLIAERAPRRVGDLAADPLFRDNPLVTVGGVRSYAGAPMVSHRGHVLGGLCVLDMQPREFGDDALAYLTGMAAEAVNRLEERGGE